MKTNEIVHGFRVTDARESRELGGTLWELLHEKTGAVLYWTDNGEANKLFSVTFKTPPRDNTGVFHILEHSVLCGSENYPVKEPFLDLLKSSMNTFLNAITFSDHTSYPVSSKNEKDFMNLTSVYLDAVFRPLLLQNELIFRQEGWRVDFGGDTPEYNGVVYNEMKGASAGESYRVFTAMGRALFPDNCYGYVNGGDPAAIPDLTYEAFLEAYRAYYHPSNAIFYLDGDVPLDDVLPLIASYLDAYEKDDTPHEIAPQQPGARRIEETYECSKDEPTENKTYLGFGKLIGRLDDRKKTGALEVLERYLFGSNESPLKRALLQTGLVKDVNFSVNDSIAQPYVSLTLRGTEAEHRDALIDALQGAVRELLADGLDSADLSAAIDRMELTLRRVSEPQGLWRNQNLLQSRLHGGDAMLFLENESVIAALRDAVGTAYYADLLREVFLDETNVVEITLRPDPAKGEKDSAREKARLAAALDAMSPAERAAEEEKYARLTAWQNTPDSPEAKRTLPELTLADVDPEPERRATERMTEDGREIYYHAYNTNGICYLNLYFNIGDFDPADIAALSFITELLSELPTEHISGALLQREVKRLFGHFSTSVIPIRSLTPPDSTPLYFNTAFHALSSKLPEAIALAAEILLRTKFDDKDRVKQILTQTKENLRRVIGMGGRMYGAFRALSPRNAEYAVRDAARGVGYYLWLRDFEKDFDARADAFASFASDMMRRICTRARLTAGETADAFHSESFACLKAFPAGETAPVKDMRIPLQSARREAIVVPGGVSCAVQCATLEDLEGEDRGDMAALAQILTYDYLWNEIRVRGGAYGCGCTLSLLDGLRFNSFRDPDPGHSLGVFADASAYLRAFCAGDESIEKYIISASAEPLLSPASIGSLADEELLGAITYAHRERRRKELLDTEKEALAAYGALLDRAKECASYCVIGSREAIEALGDGWSVLEL